MGARGCGKWMERKGDGYASVANEAWLGGALSGIAMISNNDFIKGTDAASLYLWMDNYCQAHPLDDVADGAMALAAELTRRKSK
jgi:hypothetical protein